MAKMLSGGVALSTPAAQTRLAALAAQPVRAALYYDSTVARPGMDRKGKGKGKGSLQAHWEFVIPRYYKVLLGITGHY